MSHSQKKKNQEFCISAKEVADKLRTLKQMNWNRTAIYGIYLPACHLQRPPLIMKSCYPRTSTEKKSSPTIRVQLIRHLRRCVEQINPRAQWRSNRWDLIYKMGCTKPDGIKDAPVTGCTTGSVLSSEICVVVFKYFTFFGAEI